MPPFCATQPNAVQAGQPAWLGTGAGHLWQQPAPARFVMGLVAGAGHGRFVIRRLCGRRFTAASCNKVQLSEGPTRLSFGTSREETTTLPPALWRDTGYSVGTAYQRGSYPLIGRWSGCWNNACPLPANITASAYRLTEPQPGEPLLTCTSKGLSGAFFSRNGDCC